VGEGLGLMRSLFALSGNWDWEVSVLISALTRRKGSRKLTLRFLLANEDQAEAAEEDISWTDSAISDG
jgi:hypothetical protein